MDTFTSEFRQLMTKYEQELMQLQQRAASPVNAEAIPTPPPPDEATVFTAPLSVRVTAANEAIPIAGAIVTITRRQGNVIIDEATRITNESGLTEPTILAAVDPALTLRPGNAIPVIVHDVTVSAPGYYRVRVADIPLYGGIPTNLPVSLIPVPEFADKAQEILYDTPPINL